MFAGLVVASVLVQPSVTDILARSWNEPLVVGHRGAAAYLPENTIDGFLKGTRSGAVAVECDVHMSKDGVPVVIHDNKLDRTTDGEGLVQDHTAAEMTALGVPTLEEAITTVKDKGVFVIEIKAGDGVVPAVIELVRKHKTEEQSILFSFDAKLISQAERLAPELTTVWLSATPYGEPSLPALSSRLNELNVDGVGFQFNNIHPALTTFLREREIPLFVWTVPPGPQIERLRDLGVNFIISDHPTEVRDELSKLAEVESPRWLRLQQISVDFDESSE